ncbi:TIGR00730 family Rossman fold protein [Leptothermofonsia sp. ETS-13]|uniref:LOG family protein n=1 Tax=Leptothermofonsia sp. ETS-13 TaxID=3035696 RepID=UPI003B9FA7EA
MKYLCVFCGSSPGAKPVYKLAAQQLGKALVERGLGLVYGGGNVGLMGAIADAVMAAGGEAIGVIPEFLVAKEIAHPGLSQLHVVDSMHARKAMMAELADGFIALPGGYGTYEEFCEVLTWAQLGVHQKPCGLLNVNGYYNALLALFDHAVEEEFVRPRHRGLILEDQDPYQLLDKFALFKPITLHKWVSRDEI